MISNQTWNIIVFYIYFSISLKSTKHLTTLGLHYNAVLYRSQKLISQHATRALVGLYNILNNIELPVEQKFKLFDTLVGSILNFGAEIWGTHKAIDVEL